MATYTTSRFSEGNHFFPLELTIKENMLIINNPGLIKDEAITIPLSRISSISIPEKEGDYSEFIIVSENGNINTCFGFEKEIAPLILTKLNEQIKELKLRREKELEAALFELNALEGLENLKGKISDFVKLARYYKETGENSKLAMNLVFSGNPGTGKTTVARLIGKIFKLSGVMESGHLIECGRQDLVAEFIGQTAPKTESVLFSALGGVLFIDEAYSLSIYGKSNDFGREAINTILKFMEDYRGSICIIVAGYPKLMNEFIESNPGLKSRFTHYFEFDDYNEENLLNIAKKTFENEKMILDANTEKLLSDHLQKIVLLKDNSFGNARDVRSITDEIIRTYDLRKADELKAKGKISSSNQIMVGDLKGLEKTNLMPEEKKKRIGFKPD